MSTPPAQPDLPLSAAAMAEHDALAPGTRLGELEVLRVLGVGGFGIVYLARDHSLERDVALKEYMPASLARRSEGAQITIRSASFVDTYAIGLRSFINEAKLLARFDHPSLVKVYRFWEGNGTAYMVMPYLQGHTLRDVRRAMTAPPTEAWIRGVLDRVLGALEVMHREGVYHRDIAPDNILITPEGLPVLLDFGAARRVISDRTQTLTAILKPSYAPIEQYAEMAQMRQGAWTDLYALGAVVHYLLKGVPPMPATARIVQDDRSGLDMAPSLAVSQRFMSIIDWTLALRPQDRPQDVASLRDALEGRTEPPLVPGHGATVPGAAAPMPMPMSATTGADGPTLRLSPPAQAATQIEPTFAPTQRMTAAPPRFAGPAGPAGAAPKTLLDAELAPLTAPLTAPPTPPAAPPMAKPPRRRSALALVGAAVAVVGAVAVWALVGRTAPTTAASSTPVSRSAPPVAVSETPPADAPIAPPIAPPIVAAPPPAAATPAPAPTAAIPAPAAVAPAPQQAAAPSPAVRTAQPTAPKARRTLATETSASPETGGATAPAGASAQAQPPPAQAAAPAVPPAAAPTPRAQAAADDPDDDDNAPRATLVTTARQICGNRPLYAMADCMQRQCRRPRFATDLDCLRLGPVTSRRLGDPP